MDIAKLAQSQQYKRDDYQYKDSNEPLGLIIKCYTNVGQIQSWGKVSVDARELINIDAHRTSQYVAVEIETGGEYSQSGVASVDVKNIDKLIQAIGKLKSVNPSSSKFDSIEAHVTIDDLKIVVFNTENKKMMCSIGTDSAAVHFDLYRLDDFRSLIIMAKEKIQQCKTEIP